MKDEESKGYLSKHYKYNFYMDLLQIILFIVNVIVLLGRA